MKSYKGYVPSIWYEEEDQAFHGLVEGTRDMIHFTGASVDTLTKAFHDSVDDYLRWAAEDGFEPEKPYSGKLAFRTTPEHHRLISQAASREKRSINQWIDETLAKAAEETLRDGMTKVSIR